jgi:GTP-binding protein
MESNPFRRARFMLSAHDLPDLPPEGGAEVAFAGRSNAGKSSALNALADHNRLAFVSKTPGRTQLINFFDLDDGRKLVDLPGYGYAAVPAAIKAHWQGVLAAYVGQRKSLCGVVLIMDARHPLKPLDVQLIGWLAPTGRALHCLLTKADKLTRADQNAALSGVRRELKTLHPGATAQLFSSTAKIGREEAISAIAAMMERHSSNQ